MPSPRAPSMPTKRQIEEAYRVARELCPGARIKSVGPDGVAFEYLREGSPDGAWDGKPFSGDEQ